MKRLLLTTTFVFSAAFAGCADEALDYRCTVTWCDGPCGDGGTELATASYDFANLSDSQDAVDMCGEEQGTDPERPLDANAYSCDCESK